MIAPAAEPLDRLVLESGGELTLPGPVLRRLRLHQPEPFLAFPQGRHAVQLLRAGVTLGSVQKVREAALSGDLERFGIADLFSLVNMSRRTGLLLIVADAAQKSVHFQRGEIVFAESNLFHDRLGQILYRVGKLSREALDEAEANLRSGQRFGALLLERKLIDVNALWWGIKHQIEEIVYSVFALKEGNFFFFDGGFLEPELLHFTIDTNGVLMEGYQRLDEWSVIRARIPGPDTVLLPTGKALAEKLSENLIQLLRRVDGRRSVDEIVRAAGWGEFNTYKLLYQLLQAGLVNARDVAAAGPPTADREDPLAAELNALIETHNRAFLLIQDVLRAKTVEADFGRLFQAFLRNASHRTRGVLQGLELGGPRPFTFPPRQLLENLDELDRFEAHTTSQGRDLPPSDSRCERLETALAEWMALLTAALRNLLPASEARELVGYAQTIARSGRTAIQRPDNLAGAK